VPAGAGVAVTHSPPAPGDVVLSVRIAGQHLLGSPVTLRVAPAPAPLVVKAAFTSGTLATVALDFDVDTDQAVLATTGAAGAVRVMDTCGVIFANAALLLGRGPRCAFVTPRRMEIALGVDHAVDPAGSPNPTRLAFKATPTDPAVMGGAGGGAILRAGGGSFPAAGTITVEQIQRDVPG
jgi:hypothetical protein